MYMIPILSGILLLALSSHELYTYQDSAYTYQSEHAKFIASQNYVITSAFPDVTRKEILPAKPVSVDKPPLFLNFDVPKETKPITKVQKETKPIKEIIFFDFNSYSIKPEEKVKLDKLKHVKDSIVSITGYTCDIGTKHYNDHLAIKRAKAVRDYLDVSVKPEGKGKCCYLDFGDRAKNRRVEVETTEPKRQFPPNP